MRQVDPTAVLRAHETRLARLRRMASVVRPLLLRSHRARRVLAKLVRSAPTYFADDSAVFLHGRDRQWTPGQRRLLIVTHELSASGAPRVVEEVARIFGGAGWFVTVVSPMDGPARDGIARHAAIAIDPTVLDERSPLLAALAPVSDLALANTVVSAGAVIALARATPVFWYLHEVSLLSDMLRDDPRVAQALRAARRVFAGSELSASLARGHQPDTRVLPYGLRLLPAPAPRLKTGETDAPDRVQVAIFGAIEPRKGQDLAVAALALLTGPERAAIRLTLYGRVIDRPFADRLDTAVQATPEAHWGGELDTGAYAAAMWAADVVLVSSRDDTLPLVSLDALGARRVLICTATTGTSAWIEDGTNGFVAEKADAEALATALSRALTRRADWPAIGQAARTVFDAAFSEAAFAAALLAEAAAHG